MSQPQPPSQSQVLLQVRLRLDSGLQVRILDHLRVYNPAIVNRLLEEGPASLERHVREAAASYTDMVNQAVSRGQNQVEAEALFREVAFPVPQSPDRLRPRS